MVGQEEMAPSSAREGLDWLLEKIPSLKGLPSIERATPREVVKSASLEILKRPVDVVVRDMVQWWASQCYVHSWTL